MSALIFRFKTAWQNFKSRLSLPQIRINKAFIVIIIIGLIVIPLTVFMVEQRQNLTQHAAGLTRAKTVGYIIEYKDNPLAQTIKPGMAVPAAVQAQAKSNLENNRKLAAEDILVRLGKQTFNHSKTDATSVKINGSFENVFNGVALDITQAEADKLKQSPYVKAVYPDLEVKTNLMDSVPLIGADQVWKNVKDANGNPVTGKGINVAVIDTGVDYTHPDLGGTVFNDRQFQKISTEPIVNNEELIDGTFSYNNGQIAYASGYDTVSIYTFATGKTVNVNLGTSDLYQPHIHNLLLAGNRIIYISISATAANLYWKDLTTGKVTKISDMGPISVDSGVDYATTQSQYYVWNDKLIYGRQTGQYMTVNGISGATAQNIYLYDFATGTENKLAQDQIMPYFPKVSGDELIYTVYGEDSNSNWGYQKDVVYDLPTGATRDITPPGVCPLIDFKGTTILYPSCGSWGTYYLYDITTGVTQQLDYQGDNTGGNKFSPQDLMLTSEYYMQKGAIGDGVVFFQKNVGSWQLIAYDLNSKRYVVVDLKTPYGSLAGEGKRVCFASALDSNIYCHVYDPTYSYPLPIATNSKVVGGFNFIDYSDNYLDDNAHGTHVSGIVAANGSLKGVAPGANIVAYKVLTYYGVGSASGIVAAIDAAVGTRLDTDPTNDISIINMSLGIDCGGTYDDNCGPNDIISQVVDTASSYGIVSVIAAGNAGPGMSTITSPGTARTAITVGAVDKSKKIADFSSRGPVTVGSDLVVKPDILAPGVNICSAELFSTFFPDEKCFDNSHILLSGTSMATPHIAGIAALILQLHPTWTPDQVKTAIKNNADDLGYDINTQGSGFVDALKIFNIAKPTPTPKPVSSGNYGITSKYCPQGKITSYCGRTFCDTLGTPGFECTYHSWNCGGAKGATCGPIQSFYWASSCDLTDAQRRAGKALSGRCIPPNPASLKCVANSTNTGYVLTWNALPQVTYQIYSNNVLKGTSTTNTYTTVDKSNKNFTIKAQGGGRTSTGTAVTCP
jgi:subtilisin family serine protease